MPSRLTVDIDRTIDGSPLMPAVSGKVRFTTVIFIAGRSMCSTAYTGNVSSCCFSSRPSLPRTVKIVGSPAKGLAAGVASSREGQRFAVLQLGFFRFGCVRGKSPQLPDTPNRNRYAVKRQNEPEHFGDGRAQQRSGNGEEARQYFGDKGELKKDQ